MKLDKETSIYYIKKYLNEMWEEKRIIEINLKNVGTVFLHEPNDKNERFLNIELDINSNNEFFKNFINSINLTLVDKSLFFQLIEKILNEYSEEIEDIKIN